MHVNSRAETDQSSTQEPSMGGTESDTIQTKMITNRTFFVFEFFRTVITVIDTGRYCFGINLNRDGDKKSLCCNLWTIADIGFFVVEPSWTSDLFFSPTQRAVPNFGCVLDDS